METSKSEIQRHIADALRIPFQDGIISKVNENIQPVFVSNEIGEYRVVATAATAIGADYSESLTVPAGKKWCILGGSCTFITDATVGNRTLKVLLATPTGHAICGNVNTNHAASLTRYYVLSPTAIDSASSVTTFTQNPFNYNYVMNAGDVLSFTDIANISQNDTIAIKLFIKEYSLTGI